MSVLNNPESFADEMAAGLVAAYGRFVRSVPGGVVRARKNSDSREVAVVIGGGTGHYPAFGGLVGPGLATGAAMGNVFASPSIRQVCSVARAADSGAGVLLLFGNYTGDVLNFEAARRRLLSEGRDCRLLAVTDDIASAGSDDTERRRGVAGDLTVFKVAGAAAAEGLPLDQVENLARLANDRTRTFGVAFGGCTLPGADEPLFTVPSGSMAVGMGIHGEPGLGTEPRPNANGLAELLVARVLAERPGARADRAAVILNGLGGVKYESLFVIYDRVAALLGESGVTPVYPEVGELVTSFDMPGVSLTVMWLDDRLEQLWCAPASSPAFRRAVIEADVTSGAPPEPSEKLGVGEEVDAPVVPGSRASQAAAKVLLERLEAAHRAIEDNVQLLGDMDAVAGDGDHGLGMQRGITAALETGRTVIEQGAGVGTLLNRAGDAWADRAGGTSGVLWGLMLRAAGERLGDEMPVEVEQLSSAVTEAEECVATFGGAALGDKTLLDALSALAVSLRATTLRVETIEKREAIGLAGAWGDAAKAASEAAEATRDLLPRMGRARPHAERSLGTPDPGASSLALIATAAAAVPTTGVQNNG